jgi:hypothetical protein
LHTSLSAVRHAQALLELVQRHRTLRVEWYIVVEIGLTLDELFLHR